jgi:hypothetical protein
MSAAGAGKIGDYSGCSFRTEGVGTFTGGEKTAPVVGRKNVAERVPEVRLEMIGPRRSLHAALEAMLSAHPYEEPAYDVYHLENADASAGMGVIGSLARPAHLSSFLALVRKRLGTKALRYTGDLRQQIKRVALCGGGGGELLEDAIRARADVFVTADCSYHLFHDAAGRIALVDAGHYETEAPVVASIVNRLRKEIQSHGEKILVRAATAAINPVAQSV